MRALQQVSVPREVIGKSRKKLFCHRVYRIVVVSVVFRKLYWGTQLTDIFFFLLVFFELFLSRQKKKHKTTVLAQCWSGITLGRWGRDWCWSFSCHPCLVPAVLWFYSAVRCQSFFLEVNMTCLPLCSAVVNSYQNFLRNAEHYRME